MITYACMTEPAIAAVGSRVRALREAGGMSLRDLSERSGVSAPMLSQVERGETSPTLQVAARIASGLQLRLSQLLRLDEAGAVSIVRRGERRSGGAGGHGYEILTPPLPGQRARRERVPRHLGALVERGAVFLQIDGAEHALGAGDCVTFDADLAHHFENRGEEEAVLLAIVSAGLRRS